MEASDFVPFDWREWRRLRAVLLKPQGWYQRDISHTLGVSEETVSRWLARTRDGGPAALRARPRSGHPPKLSAAQKRLIPEFLWHGPGAYGFPGEVWTCARVAWVIEQELGVRYHKGHVGRLLQELRWTPQVPIKRAIQRDEEAIGRWRDEVWPEPRRRAHREHRTLVFADESGFYLLRTYAPEGLTPVLREKLSRDHRSVMGGMTPEARSTPWPGRSRSLACTSVEFLIHLGRVAGDRLLVIWDGSPIHRRAEVQEFISGTRSGVWLEALPGYAPDLNPWNEGGWHHLKNVAMGNLVCLDLEQFHEEFHLAVGRLRRKPHLVQSFFAQAGLTIEKPDLFCAAVGRAAYSRIAHTPYR